MIDVRWIQNLPSEKKKSFELALRNDTLVLGRLLEILESEDAQLDRQSFNVNELDKNNYEHRRTFRDGRRSGIGLVRELLSFLKGPK